MGDSVHPFAAGAGLLPEPTPVNVTQIDVQTFGWRRWYFDQPFAGPPAGIDPAFEVSVDGINWSGPSSYAYVGPNSARLGYPLDYWGATFWRVLTTPTVWGWAPAVFNPPQSGTMPYP